MMVGAINESFKERSKTLHNRSTMEDDRNGSLIRSNSNYRLSPNSQKSIDYDDLDEDGF